MLWAKVLAASYANSDGGGAFGCRSPRWGVIFELHPLLFGVLLAKAQFSSWMDNGGAIGVVTSLEALLLETQHSLESAAEGGDGDVQEDELQGGCQAHELASRCFGDVQRLLHGY